MQDNRQSLRHNVRDSLGRFTKATVQPQTTNSVSIIDRVKEALSRIVRG